MKSRTWSPIAKDVKSKVPAAIKSAARALRVIEYFVETRRNARAIEIAEQLGLPQSSTSVLLNSMVRLGYLDFDFNTHTYQPALRAAMLSAWIEDGPFRDGSVLDMIQHMAEETGYAVSLSTRSTIYVRYIYAIQARDPAVARITPAIRRYVIWSSSGMAILADASRAEIQALINKTREENDPFAQQISSVKVLERIAMTVQQGYFFGRGLVTAEAGSISIKLPISLTGSHRTAALSVAGSLESVAHNERDIVEKMRAAINRLEKRYAGK